MFKTKMMTQKNPRKMNSISDSHQSIMVNN